MLRGEDFTAAVRLGARAGSRRLVVHYRAGESGETTPALVGVVVPKKQVARATHRNRIKRRLRALMRARVAALPAGSRLVVRGLAGADGASSAVLAEELDRLLHKAQQTPPRKDAHR